MEELIQPFEFKVDMNTPYMKTIRFMGAFFLGFLIAIIFMKYRYGDEIEWMATVAALGSSLVFALFPGMMKEQYITLNEEGIKLHGYSMYGGQEKEIKWESVQAVRLDRNAISIKNRIGSIEKVKLPIYTKEQIAQLKVYLKQLSELKNIIYGI